MRRTGASRGRRRGSGGFTLFEIIVAIAVVGLIMGVAVSQMGDFLEWDLKKATNKMAATIRYLYNKAATEGLYLRLVLDLEEQTYWVEATSDPLTVRRGAGGASLARGGEGEEPAEEETAEGEIPKLKPPKPTFGQVDSHLLRPTKLPGSVFFKDVQVEHREGTVGDGKVAIYFFPNGFMEEAIINFRDEGDEVYYSIRTHPLSGRADIEAGYRRLEEER